MAAFICMVLAGGVHGQAVDGEVSRVYDDEGWFKVSPGEGDIVIYVSSSLGSDANHGRDEDKPVRTIRRAMGLVGVDRGDVMLLKRGDEWYEGLAVNRSGRSVAQPLVFGSYGDQGDRPVLYGPVKIEGDYIALIGLCIKGGGKSVGKGEGIETTWNKTRRGLYFEDLMVTGWKTGLNLRLAADVVVKRCVITDNKGAGLYADNYDGLVIEENVFDDNGYDANGDGVNERGHNVYESRGGRGFVARGNILANGGDQGLKMRADTQGVVIENNLFVRNRNDLHLMLDSEDVNKGWRHANVRICDNVFTDTGREGHQTAVWVGHAVDVLIQGNLMVNAANSAYSAAIRFEGRGGSEQTLTNVKVFENTVTKYTAEGIRFAAAIRNIKVAGNVFDLPMNDGHMTEIYKLALSEEYEFAGNHYNSAYGKDQWFWVQGAMVGFDRWIELSGEKGATAGQVEYVDADRTLGGYQGQFGDYASIRDFVKMAREQSRSHWRASHTAAAVNDYLRQGYTVVK